MEFLFIFAIGVFIGSFLNVAIDRLPRKETIAKGRSHCEFCKKELAWYDLIPLLSFLMLKGKCRYCHKSIGIFYPIIEFSTGILFLTTFMFVYGLNFQFPARIAMQSVAGGSISNSLIFNLQSLISLVYYLFIVSSFIVIFFEDLKFGIIPDKVVFPAIIVSSIYLIFNFPLDFTRDGQFSIFNFVFSAIGAFVFFLILFLITKGKGMGFGDVKLSFLLGLILGFPKIILALYLAFLTGAIIGIILIIWRKKRSIKDTIPFGPFLILGTILALFYGDLLIPKIIIFLGLP